MSYNRKTVPLKKEEFEQLAIYIQQVDETIKIIKSKHKRKHKLDDWLNALSIHNSILDNYFQSLSNAYKVKVPSITE